MSGANLVQRALGGKSAPAQVGPQVFYDDRGNMYTMGPSVPTAQTTTTQYSGYQQTHGVYHEPGYGYPKNYYSWCGSSWRLGNFWWWFCGLVGLVMLALGVVAFGLVLSHGSRIWTLEDQVAALTTTVNNQGQALAQLTTPFEHSAAGSLVTTNVKQFLDCGGGVCAMTLPADLSAYTGLPEICVVSKTAQAHTVTIAAGALFQPSASAVATFGGDIGDNFCFIVTSSTTAAVTSSENVSF